jgi:hypothetical protein
MTPNFKLVKPFDNYSVAKEYAKRRSECGLVALPDPKLFTSPVPGNYNSKPAAEPRASLESQPINSIQSYEAESMPPSTRLVAPLVRDPVPLRSSTWPVTCHRTSHPLRRIGSVKRELSPDEEPELTATQQPRKKASYSSSSSTSADEASTTNMSEQTRKKHRRQRTAFIGGRSILTE